MVFLGAMSSDSYLAGVVRGSGQIPICPATHVWTEARTLINHKTVGAKHIEMYLVDILPGGEGFVDEHRGEHGYYILSGEGEADVEGVRHLLQKEDCLFIPDGAVHSVKTLGAETLKTIVFMAPHRNLG